MSIYNKTLNSLRPNFEKLPQLSSVQKWVRATMVAAMTAGAAAPAAEAGARGEGQSVGSISRSASGKNIYFDAVCDGQGAGDFTVQITHLGGNSGGVAETDIRGTNQQGKRLWWSTGGYVSPEHALRMGCPDPAPKVVENSQETIEECLAKNDTRAIECILNGNYFDVALQLMEKAHPAHSQSAFKYVMRAGCRENAAKLAMGFMLAGQTSHPRDKLTGKNLARNVRENCSDVPEVLAAYKMLASAT